MNTGKTLFQFEKRSWNKISESLEEAHEHGKVLFQLFWNKTGTDPAILGVRLLPPPTFQGARANFFELISAHKRAEIGSEQG